MLKLNDKDMEDHNLLIKMNAKLDNILHQVYDHEKRLRWIERIGIIGLTGYIIVKEVLLKILV